MSTKRHETATFPADRTMRLPTWHALSRAESMCSIHNLAATPLAHFLHPIKNELYAATPV